MIVALRLYFKIDGGFHVLDFKYTAVQYLLSA